MGKDVFFPSNTYIFTVEISDIRSKTKSELSCKMYSAPSGSKILNFRLAAENNKNGYIDFNADLAAFKA